MTTAPLLTLAEIARVEQGYDRHDLVLYRRLLATARAYWAARADLERERPVTARAVELIEENARLRAVVEAAKLKRNVIIHDNPSFVGEWVAVPREDFDRLSAARRATETP